MKNKIPFSVVIANKVRQGIRSGVLVKDIMGSIQKYQYAPASLATFYKLYGSIMSEEKADVVSRIGDVVVQHLL